MPADNKKKFVRVEAWFSVRIGGRVTYLYQAGTRWFVEQKHP